MILSSGSLVIVNAPKWTRRKAFAEDQFTLKKNSRKNPGDPRIKIMEAAGEMFARQGFKGATLQEICEKLAINRTVIYYYFSSKEQLYKAVMDYTIDRENREIQKLDSLYTNLPPVKRFQSLIQALLSHLMKSQTSSWHWQLIVREMISSSDGPDEMTSERFSPLFQCVGQAIRQLSPRLKEEDVKQVTLNVLGMIFQHSLYRLPASKMRTEIDDPTNSLEKITTCIVNMSLAALRQVNESDRNMSMVNRIFLFIRPQ